MIYMTENFEITEDKEALYQINIPRSISTIPSYYVNEGNKRANKKISTKIKMLLQKEYPILLEITE